MVSDLSTALLFSSQFIPRFQLFKEGGNLVVQTRIYSHLVVHSSYFFVQVIRILDGLMSWHSTDKTEIDELPEEYIIIRFLQLLCEGHYKPNQDLLPFYCHFGYSCEYHR